MQFPNLQSWYNEFDSILPAISVAFAKLDALFPTIPIAIALAAFLIPIVLALFSKRTIVFLGCMLIAAIALSVLLHPSSIASIMGAGAYVGSILLAIFGIQMRRKASAVHTELMNFRSELDELRSIEETRYLSELKKGRKKPRSKNIDSDSDSDSAD